MRFKNCISRDPKQFRHNMQMLCKQRKQAKAKRKQERQNKRKAKSQRR